ncbi:MAG: ABC transporter ATP-binding protein [Pseudomonadales bacterium]
MSEPLFCIDQLQVGFPSAQGTVHAVRGVSLAVAAGETLAVVGESGCGKSVSFAASLGLLPQGQPVELSGSVRFDGVEILGLKETSLNQYRGRDIAMIFQDPMAALNPTMRIGDQVAETLRVHQGCSRGVAMAQAHRLLDQVRLSNVADRLRQYPFELSGGMLQRVMIATALANNPRLLIADEPTTALDVTTQDQILSLLRDLRAERDMALVLITHDLAVVSQMADRVAVMYAGEVVERAEVDDLFTQPRHPYTQGLLASLPSSAGHQLPMAALAGTPPNLLSPPVGCAFHPRCAQAMNICARREPEVVHGLACWLQQKNREIN